MGAKSARGGVAAAPRLALERGGTAVAGGDAADTAEGEPLELITRLLERWERDQQLESSRAWRARSAGERGGAAAARGARASTPSSTLARVEELLCA